MSDTCDLCGDKMTAIDEGCYCSWCRSEARTYINGFSLYKESDKLDLYEIIEEEAQALWMREYNRRKKEKKNV